jgi:hypothetical protein
MNLRSRFAIDPAEIRRRWVPWGAAFLVGLLVGTLVIGWWLWPVSYTNALPPDLRASERDQYLLMVAESYGVSSNLPVAKERLATWPTSKLLSDLTNLQSRMTLENGRQADQVQRLTSALNLRTASAATPAVTPSATAARSALPIVPGKADSGLLQRVCAMSVWVVLALLGVVVVAYIWRRWRLAQNAGGYTQPAASQSATRAPRGNSSRSAATLAKEVEGTWPDAPWEATPAGPVQPAPAATRQPPAPEVPARPIATETRGVAIATADLVYRMGEPEYDETYAIHDQNDEYLGDCGLSLATPIGPQNDQAAALNAFLAEPDDPQTQIRVLMSEGAFQDQQLREQLARSHQSMPVHPGTVFELTTANLVLKGTVTKLGYANDGSRNSIFAELGVRFEVFHKGGKK